jgi:hypothetical protein
LPQLPKELYILPDWERDHLQDHIPTQRWDWYDEDWSLGTDFETDEEGWVYMVTLNLYKDTAWNTPKSKRSLGSYTRSRKWVKNMKMVPCD